MESYRISMPEPVQFIIHKIMAAGFEAFAVGGCVRDSILGRTPKDWDITTSALPQQIKALFPRTVDTGIQHGTVTVLLNGEGYEVTTYRIDGRYEDGRHPAEVTFTPSLEEDLRRRDLTINAMAYNDQRGLVDLYGGRRDLRDGIVRCVGDPLERFQEDALRMMRTIRFSAQLGYRIEENTKDAIGRLADTLARVSAERIQAELVGLLTSPHPEYLREAYECGVTRVFLPEFDKAMETGQNHPHHRGSVGEHTLWALSASKPDRTIRLAVLFHDMGKPDTLTVDDQGITHFYGHAKKGEEITRKILQRLKFDNGTVQAVCKLVLYHDYAYAAEPDMADLRRMIHKIGEDAFPGLFEVRRADILGQSSLGREEKLARLEGWESMYQTLSAERQCVSLRTLAVSGRDLCGIGMRPGREIGEMLERLLELVLEDPSCNTKEFLLARARDALSGTL